MSEKSQALRLITDLLADFNDPSFVWQGVALVACLGLSFLIARWWRGAIWKAPAACPTPVPASFFRSPAWY
jgi:hypothetical protein